MHHRRFHHVRLFGLLMLGAGLAAFAAAAPAHAQAPGVSPGGKPPGANPGGPGGRGPGRGGPGWGGGPPPATVVLDAVIEERIGQTTPVIGRIVARQSGPVAARIGGPVVEMRIEVGDRVGTGDILARIDRERMQLERDRHAAVVAQQKANLAASRADIEKKRNQLERLEGIRGSAAFPQARFEDTAQDLEIQSGRVAETRARLVQAQTLLKRAERDLLDTEIRAPFPGVVSATHTEIGAYLTVGAPVATVINDTNLEIEADIPNVRIAGLRAGDEVAARLDAGRVVRATLRAVVPDENPRTRTRPVRFTPRFDGPGAPLADNQSVTVMLPVGGSRSAVTVSKDAVIESGGSYMVFVAADGRAQPRAVAIGEAAGSRLVVVSGLRAGERVVVRGNEQLRPGQRLREAGAGRAPANGAGGG